MKFQKHASITHYQCSIDTQANQSRFSEEFKLKAVKQVIRLDYDIGDASEQLGIGEKVLNHWIKQYEIAALQQELNQYKVKLGSAQQENAKLSNEVGLLRRAIAYFAQLSIDAEAAPPQRVNPIENDSPSAELINNFLMQKIT